MTQRLRTGCGAAGMKGHGRATGRTSHGGSSNYDCYYMPGMCSRFICLATICNVESGNECAPHLGVLQRKQSVRREKLLAEQEGQVQSPGFCPSASPLLLSHPPMQSHHKSMKHARVTYVKCFVSTQLRQIMPLLPGLHSACLLANYICCPCPEQGQALGAGCGKWPRG